MKTEQVNIRLEADVVAALERVAREESLDRGTVIRRFIEASISEWQEARAVEAYRRGEQSLGRAADEAGLTQWELLDAARASGVVYPLERADVAARLDLLEHDSGPGDVANTLPDRPPAPGGVLLVGINPAPVSVAAGHYYQGRLGKRLWRRLERAGLLGSPVPGAEDDAFAAAGHGLTDLVKRPTESASDVRDAELREGAAALRDKVASWQPGLVLFVFKGAAAAALESDAVSPGIGPPIAGVPTFLLPGPYARRDEVARLEGELAGSVAARPHEDEGAWRSQTVTDPDRAAGRIRFPRAAKGLFPSGRASVEVVLRGTRIAGRYDPRTGPDRERSAVLSVDRDVLSSLVRVGEVLRVSRGLGGVVRLD